MESAIFPFVPLFYFPLDLSVHKLYTNFSILKRINICVRPDRSRFEGLYNRKAKKVKCFCTSAELFG